MERDGLVVVAGDRHLELTDAAAARAVAVMRKHRLAERLLTDVIGLEWELVHAEACRWEHVMSEAVERKLVQLLDNPTISPYGNPIPGLDELAGPPEDDAPRACPAPPHAGGRPAAARRVRPPRRRPGGGAPHRRARAGRRRPDGRAQGRGHRAGPGRRGALDLPVRRRRAGELAGAPSRRWPR